MAIETFVPADFDPDFGNFALPGKYHARILSVDEDGGEKGEMIIVFEVLAGSPGGQEGTTNKAYFAKSAKAMGRIHQLAICLGMVTKARIKEAAAAGEGISYDFAAQVGKQLFIHLEADEYNGKERAKLGFGFYPLSSPQCVAWVASEQAAKAGGYTLPPRQHAEQKKGLHPLGAPKSGGKSAPTAAPSESPSVSGEDLPF